MSLSAFGEPVVERPPRRGLLLLLDVFVAPRRAFETIAATREWLPALLVVMALGIAGSLLVGPALEHTSVAEAVANANAGAISPAEAARNAGAEVASVIVFQTAGVAMMWIWTAVILAAVSGKGPSSFGVYFALAANVALPSALGFFISTLYIAHDPAAYANFSQLNRAFPDSLALLEPRDNERAVAFLSSFDVFGLWSTMLLAFGLRAIGKVELFWALVTAFALWLATALLQIVPGI